MRRGSVCPAPRRMRLSGQPCMEQSNMDVHCFHPGTSGAQQDDMTPGEDVRTYE
jgi:hypothetical protein